MLHWNGFLAAQWPTGDRSFPELQQEDVMDATFLPLREHIRETRKSNRQRLFESQRDGGLPRTPDAMSWAREKFGGNREVDAFGDFAQSFYGPGGAPIVVMQRALDGGGLRAASLLVCAMAIVRSENERTAEDGWVDEIDGDPLEDRNRDWIEQVERRVTKIAGLVPLEGSWGFRDEASGIVVMLDDVHASVRRQLCLDMDRPDFEWFDRRVEADPVPPSDVLTYAYDMVADARSAVNPIISMRREVQSLIAQYVPSAAPSPVGVGL
jgi:hypothetical protein